jgi:uncharacterized protein YecE (DUF72 family)
MIQVGCCGFPKAQVMYTREFKLVEVQQTFYHPPKIETVRRWREELPENFQFTLKAWQLITHRSSSPTYRRLKMTIPQAKKDRYGSFQPTEEVFTAWNRIQELSNALRVEIVLFQCPASFRPVEENLANMRAFFRAIRRDQLRFVWEPRGPWPEELIRDLCQELNLIHATDPFVRPPQHGELNYFRLHGIGGYRYRYTDEDLEALRRMCASKPRSLCLFNNVTMYQDAMRFRSMV